MIGVRAVRLKTKALGATGLGLFSLSLPVAAHAQEAANPDVDKTESVVVTAKRPSLDAAAEKILDTAQSINVVPAEIIRQQGVASLQEALRNVPGVTFNAGEGGTHGDLVNLRGFSAGDDYFLDGLRDTGLYNRDAFDVDSIEVYKGPASTLFGRGSTGGVINQVSKGAHLIDDYNGALTLGDNEEWRAVADINKQITNNAAVRLAAMDMDAHVADRPHVENKRWGLAPSLAVGLGTDNVFTLKYLHQEEDNLPDYGVPFLFGKPAPVSRDAFYGLPADDKFSTDVDVVTGRYEHRFNDNLSFSDTARYGNYDFDSRQTAAIYGSANCYATAPYAGAPVCATTTNPVLVTTFNPLFPVLGTPTNQIFVERDRPSSTGTITTWMDQADLTAKFATFGVDHTLVVGLEGDSEKASLVRFTNQNTLIAPTPLLDPDPNEAFPGHQTTVRQLPVTKTDTIGAFAVDTLHFGPQWDFIAGVRWDRFHADFTQSLAPVQHFEHTDNVTSPRAALVYKPIENASLYVSYGTSFNPSAENLSLAANNQALPPEKDHTYEAGGKIEVLDNKLALTAAVFNTEMTNARITDPLQPTLQALAGNEKVNGAEVTAQGYLTDHWEVVAGYTYLDAAATGLTVAGLKGPVPNTAHNQANLWTTYDFTTNIELGAGVNYISKRFAGLDTGTAPGSIIVPTVPGYVTFDAMGSWQATPNVKLQLNAYNLFDKFYYINSYFTRPNENHTVPGPGRTLLFTVSFAH